MYYIGKIGGREIWVTRSTGAGVLSTRSEILIASCEPELALAIFDCLFATAHGEVISQAHTSHQVTVGPADGTIY